MTAQRLTSNSTHNRNYKVLTEEMQVEQLMDCPVAEAIGLMSSDKGGRRCISLQKLIKKTPIARDISAITEESYDGYLIQELETGSIVVLRNGTPVVPVKPILRELALKLNVGLLNGNGNPLNTRQLGSQVIKSISETRFADRAMTSSTGIPEAHRRSQE